MLFKLVISNFKSSKRLFSNLTVVTLLTDLTKTLTKQEKKKLTLN